MPRSTIMDSAPIGPPPDDLGAVVADAAMGANFKMMFAIFLIFMIITSDVFVTRVLSNISGAVDYKCATNYGTALQGMLLVMLYVMVDTAARHGLI